MLWFISFLTLLTFNVVFVIKHRVYLRLVKPEVKQIGGKVWPHEFRIIEKREDNGKPYFIVLRWRYDEWSTVGRFVADGKVTAYFNVKADDIYGYIFDKKKWDTEEEAQEIANAYCEYHKNVTFEKTIGEFTVQ